MAVTKLIPIHYGKRRSAVTAFSDVIGYVKNPEKTDDEKYIYSFECDARMADQEFYLSKRRYDSLAGRDHGKNTIIAYHLRQSFMPGEITPEEANLVGQELASKLTKGNHAFIVCTHIDKHHIHNHIIFNSVTLDCKRKFRNFWGSSRAIQQMNDRICLEHGLSIVEHPEKSKSLDYGAWLGDKKQVSYAEQLRFAIDAVLDKHPKDFDAFVKGLEGRGIEVNQGRKYLRFKMPGQERYTRCNTLKGAYTETAIRDRIAGRRVTLQGQTKGQATSTKVNMLVDIDAAIRAGKGPGYERWAKVFNLKQLSQAVIYLKEHGNMSYEELQGKAKAVTEQFNDLSTQIKDLESQMKANGELQKQIVNYAKTRKIYVEYRQTGYSKKYKAEHEGDILIHQAAKKYFDSLGVAKLPSVKSLRENYANLLSQKRKVYASYKQVKAEMKEIQNVKVNIDGLFGNIGIDQKQSDVNHKR